MQQWLDAHPEWSERKAMDVAVSLFLIVHNAGNPAFDYAEQIEMAKERLSPRRFAQEYDVEFGDAEAFTAQEKTTEIARG